MTISYNWLHDYLPETIDPNTLSNILTSVGLEVESMEEFDSVKGGLKGLIIGEVLSCEQHPNADKLKVTTVDVGADNPLNIVCGAPNVAVGQKVVVATVGCILHPNQGEPFEIKKAKIRGSESEGMLCAEDEIGLGTSHAGIIVLPQEAKVGMLAKEYYNLPKSDIIYEIGLTPNRMDAMSHLGVAKDVCAYLSNQRNEPVLQNIPKPNCNEQVNKTDAIKIEIQNTSKCARYAGVCLENVTVTHSPDWLQQKLRAIGLRPINNVVDITNFVMHECGQPIHAFDRKMISGDTILVKDSTTDTVFVTLDGKSITLHPDDLLICNSNEPMCIAGVYGGLESGVKESTTSLFIESAWFAPDTVRQTSLRHGLRTDSATRFEKGADISQVSYALQRAVSLLQEYAGAQISSPWYDIYPQPREATLLQLDQNYVRKLAGKQYTNSQIRNILSSLYFEIVSEENDLLTISVPFAKTDITMPADVVEEIMRIDGLDNIPFTGKISYSMPTETGYKRDVKQYISTQLVAKGFYEIFTNSITNAAYYSQGTPLVKMMNSLSANLDAMRYSMLETGLESVAYNLNRKSSNIKFFEFGKTYKLESEKEMTFNESNCLALYFSGNMFPKYYARKTSSVDLYFARGIIDSVFSILGFTYSQTNNGMEIYFRKTLVGELSVVDEVTRTKFDIKQEVLYASLNWDIIRPAFEQLQIRYKEIPKYPTMERDLAIVIDKRVQYHAIESAVKQAKCTFLQHMNLFDVFESEKLGPNNISYALNFSFLDPNKTLTDKEVEEDMSRITASLQKHVNATVRS